MAIRKYGIHEEGKPYVGYLYYHEEDRTYELEALPNAIEMIGPIALCEMVRLGKIRVGHDVAYCWVRERVVPPTRQNINDILKEAGFPYYDEILFIDKWRGHCGMDNFLLDRIE